MFLIRNHHRCLSKLVLFHLNTYVMGLQPLFMSIFSVRGPFIEVFRHQILTSGDRPWTSESDVFSRSLR